MLLWSLLLVILYTLGTHGSCPSNSSISPCSCTSVLDKYGYEFSVINCQYIHSEANLNRIIDATKKDEIFELKLIDSVLRYIPHDIFIDTAFQVLTFENSSISALSDTDIAFQGLENSLHLIEITNCSFVARWDWAQLSHLKHLMEVVVINSDLMDIANGLNKIQHLDMEAFVLQNNSIGYLDTHVFAPFSFLTRISLDRNYIDKLQRTMFPKPANQLKILGLSYNRLSFLPDDLFTNMPVLSSLYLTGNPLQTVNENVFRPIWKQIHLFFFYNTALSCDCRLTWITKTDNSRKYIHAVCHAPAHLKGRHISSVEAHELWC